MSETKAAKVKNWTVTFSYIVLGKKWLTNNREFLNKQIMTTSFYFIYIFVCRYINKGIFLTATLISTHNKLDEINFYTFFYIEIAKHKNISTPSFKTKSSPKRTSILYFQLIRQKLNYDAGSNKNQKLV